MKEQAKFVLFTQYLSKSMTTFQLKHVVNQTSLACEYTDSRSARTALDRQRIPTSHSHNNSNNASSPHAVYTHVGLKKVMPKNGSKERSGKNEKLPP
jgi:hypothetical protein